MIEIEERMREARNCRKALRKRKLSKSDRNEGSGKERTYTQEEKDWYERMQELKK